MRPGPPDDDWTLGEARDWLRERIDEGAECPCCRQFAKAYHRKIHATMARVLIKAYRLHQREWFYLPDLTTAGHVETADAAKLRYWGLIITDDREREDGSKRTGWWRITDRGVEYVYGRARLPKYARVYAKRCIGFEGEPQTIVEALGTKFNYRDLMEGL